jgi:thiol-disulfide isomerase/thioredoxin
MNWGANRFPYLIPWKQYISMKTAIRNGVSVGMAILFAGALFFLVRANVRLFFGSSAGDASKAPAWELMDLDGKPVKSSDFDGKVLILDFWATSCPSCEARIPGLIELQKKYGERGLVVIGVLLDEEGPSVAKQFIKEVGINYPVVVGAFSVAEYFGGVGIPSTFIIDRSGRIVARHIGFASSETFEREITPLL